MNPEVPSTTPTVSSIIRDNNSISEAAALQIINGINFSRVFNYMAHYHGDVIYAWLNSKDLTEDQKVVMRAYLKAVCDIYIESDAEKADLASSSIDNIISTLLNSNIDLF